MRSRTLGPAKVKELAPKLGLSEKVLAIHNDQYLPADFDIVISSIGNAFYVTDKKTKKFEWKPTELEKNFLEKIGFTGKENLKDFTFKTIFVAKGSDLAINNNQIICTRGLCKNKKACGFIPNYPIINFDKKTNKPMNKWVPIQQTLSLFESIVKS